MFLLVSVLDVQEEQLVTVNCYNNVPVKCNGLLARQSFRAQVDYLASQVAHLAIHFLKDTNNDMNSMQTCNSATFIL